MSPNTTGDSASWPPVEGLDDDDVAAIAAYVRENQRICGFDPFTVTVNVGFGVE